MAGDQHFRTRAIVPDVEDVVHLAGRLGWLPLLFDNLIVPTFPIGNSWAKTNERFLYGRHRASLEAGWTPADRRPFIWEPVTFYEEQFRPFLDAGILEFEPADDTSLAGAVRIVDEAYGLRDRSDTRSPLTPSDTAAWRELSFAQAHTIGSVTFSKEGDVMYAAMEGERIDLTEQLLVRQASLCLRAPVVSSQHSLLLVAPDRRWEGANSTADDFLRRIRAHTSSIRVSVPQFRDLSADLLVYAREKHASILRSIRKEFQQVYSGVENVLSVKNDEPTNYAASAVQLARIVDQLIAAMVSDRSTSGVRIANAFDGKMKVLVGFTDWASVVPPLSRASLLQNAHAGSPQLSCCAFIKPPRSRLPRRAERAIPKRGLTRRHASETDDVASSQVTGSHISVFLSYSWDSGQHKSWVLRLARALEEQPDIRVTFDQFDLLPGRDLTHFMEKGLGCDRIVIISTPGYVRKASRREGGVGYECSIITSVLAKDMLEEKFIPVLRSGAAVPVFLRTKIFVPAHEPLPFDAVVQDILRSIRRQPTALRPEKRPASKS